MRVNGSVDKGEEVSREHVAVLAEYRFGMKLDRMNGAQPMSNPLDDSVVAASVDPQLCRNRGLIEAERVVARRGKRRGQARK